jgi:hypothetical protein
MRTICGPSSTRHGRMSCARSLISSMSHAARCLSEAHAFSPRDLENKLAIDYGEDAAFQPMEGQCVELLTNE